MFDANVTPAATYNYSYNISGDGWVSSTTNPFSVTFTNPGANEVIFKVEYYNLTSPFSVCTVYDTITIHVQGVDVPNVFSPNGDGINDFFVVDNHGMETLNMLIFNRWGSKVYEWNTTQTAWDGTGLDGEDVADGVYFYILTAVGEDGHPYEERGNVILIR